MVLCNCKYSCGQNYLAPLVNIIKEGCENKSVLFILLIFHLEKSQKSNLSASKTIKVGEGITL